MVTINPADCKPDEVYEGTANGERWTMRRAFPEAEHYRWHMSKVRPGVTGIYSRKVGDSDVSFLVRLVTAREVTRQDLTPRRDLVALMYETRPKNVVADLILNAVMDHLNANGGTPAGDAHGRVLDLVAEVNDLKAERDEALRERDEARRETDRWRRAHGIVEQERDQAREQRDEWKARAERAEAKIKPGSPLNQQAEAWQRIISHPAINPSLRECGRSYSDLAFDRVTWLFEAAEARTAVTRDEVEKAIQGCAGWHPSAAEARMQAVARLADAVCVLFGVEAEPADPVEPEGDVIVRDAHDRMWWVTDDGWTNGTSRLDHDWADVPKPIRVTYRAESEAKR